ncbi:cytochrome P460 family protein [Methylococcus sp. ANG]|jgi:hypothetical protein|uniref:cytochrome P460 family protein n=1 Tax=unclassified Methylococcus TaxID=2618889 RepID=UPI001C52ECB4|nr:cytochrome P460 family protein [Methylococcus sp. Mc7]QXP82807.1 cytochrome P460 family protein [Methylococcus sp. Mc7]
MLRIILSVLATSLLGGTPAIAADTPFSPYVDDQGSISLPKDYRQKWTHLGSWVVDEEGAPGQGFHDVYTQPESVNAFRKDGKFPDGTVLVKEIRSIQKGKETTGRAMWAGDVAIWFVMVKDSANRFPNNPNWGGGWGWGLYKAEAPDKNASSDWTKDCQGCHIPAKGSDWVYLKGYPTLK